MSPLDRLYTAGLLTVTELGAAHVYGMAWQRRGQSGPIGMLFDTIGQSFDRHGLPAYAIRMIKRVCVDAELPHSLEHRLAGDASGRSGRDLDVLRTMLGLVVDTERAVRA